MAVETQLPDEESDVLHSQTDTTLPQIRHQAASVKRSAPERRSHARAHLVYTLRDRGLKGPLKWSRWVSEVQIPNYRTACRSLGDPLLFTKSHRLPTALAKREEFLMDHPLATFSYHVHSASPNPKRKLQQPLLGREVTISEIRRMMSRVSLRNTENTRVPSSLTTHTSPTNYSASTELIDSSGLKISIQDSENSTSLPHIKLTLKQEPDKDAISRLRRTFKSPSWSPDTGPGWKPTPDREFDSVRDLLINEHTQPELKDYNQLPLTNPRNSKRHLALSSITKQPNMERVTEWVHKSPLDSAPEEDPTMRAFKSQKPTRRVRFGGRDWMYKDEAYLFD